MIGRKINKAGSRSAGTATKISPKIASDRPAMPKRSTPMPPPKQASGGEKPSGARDVKVPSAISGAMSNMLRRASATPSSGSSTSYSKSSSPLSKMGGALGGAARGMGMFKKGGDVKESKEMMKKEVSFMKKKGAPKSMIKHEEAEMKGAKKYARGGGIEVKGKTKGKIVKMACGGKAYK